MTPTPKLSLYLASVYTLLAIYGSLYSSSGWHDSGVDPFAFLIAGWPRYFTAFDLITNTLAYLPLGFLWVTLLVMRLPPGIALILTVLLGGTLSLGVESVQNFLPSRIPSNLDLACNIVGALVGAMAGLRWANPLLDGGRLYAWRERYFLAGSSGDYGLLLIALWLLTQGSPETFLFGNGNLRGLIGLSPALDFDVGHFIELEMTNVATHTLAIALIGSRLAIHHPVRLPLVMLGVAVVIKSLALMILMEGVQGFAWVTPGTLGGVAAGVVLWWGSMLTLSSGGRQAIAAMALMLATVLANLMPDNPYLANTLSLWQQGHFLNFNGLTRLISSLWPFLVIPWLIMSKK